MEVPIAVKGNEIIAFFFFDGKRANMGKPIHPRPIIGPNQNVFLASIEQNSLEGLGFINHSGFDVLIKQANRKERLIEFQKLF